MFQLAPNTGLVETVGLPPKSRYYVENLLLIQYFYDWFMCPKYMWLDMPDAFCCRLSLFRVFAKIKKTFQLAPVSLTLFGYIMGLINSKPTILTHPTTGDSRGIKKSPGIVMNCPEKQ